MNGQISVGGMYTFELSADRAAKLWIDEQLIAEAPPLNPTPRYIHVYIYISINIYI